MDSTHYTRNTRDVSRSPHEVDAGFQFEFYCERCHDTWRSPFEPYRRGQIAGWLGRAASLFSGLAYDAGRAAAGLADAGYGEARDEAFRQAIQRSEQHFHRCGRCSNQCCSKCWNTPKGLCLNCAPDLQAEVEQARSEGEVMRARERAHLAGENLANQVDVERPSTNACPKCKAPTLGSKFCPECGCNLAAFARLTCRKCQTVLPGNVKFCVECGTATTPPG